MLDESDIQTWRALRMAAARPEIDAALRGLYARLDGAVAARGPTCWQSGQCCKFDSYGHRLYVTALEVAWFGRQAPALPPRHPQESNTDAGRVALPQLGAAGETPRTSGFADACPYQVNGLCTTHAIRPLGCRVFFCEAGTETWQHQLYEDFLAELRTLHERFDLPYRYLEWRAGLAEAALA